MAANIETAYDEIFGAFRTAWNAGAGAYNGGVVPEIVWEGIGEAGPKPQEVPWARAMIRHLSGGQATLLGDAAVTRFERSGIITIQVFYPLGSGSLENVRGLANVARSAFEGKKTASNIWFRDVRINEAGPDGPWFQINVLAVFEYDELVS